MADDDILTRAKDRWKISIEDPAGNYNAYEADTRFVRRREQWPGDIKQMRANRPCLTIDKLGPVIRQVVNDARQNRPQIKVHPVDSGADVETADVLDGLIRNIQYSSDADVAYDTAVECAVGGGFGYFRITSRYTHDDAFDQDLAIERIPNPMAVRGDPHSIAADSSDWNFGFIETRLSKEEYESQYGADKEKVDWSGDAWADGWLDEDGVLVAEYWERTEYEKTIVKATDGKVFDEEELKTDPDLVALQDAGVLVLATDRKTGQPLRRVVKCYKVTQYILSGQKVLKTTDWPGQYIPIIPVYGDEFWVDGKRYLRSLINGAVDAQKMFNVMRSTAVELWGLAPKVPFIGPKGAFNSDKNWANVQNQSLPFLEFDGAVAPQRQPMDPGVATGAMSEALAASDDIKSITGLYDASLGQRSNETSGKAILARQREGDVSTFHFIDNLQRSIRHAGRVLIDLIPHFYSTARIIRVIGEDDTQQAVQVNAPTPKIDSQTGKPMVDQMGQVVMAMHDLTVGKYDVTVEAGPSFTTRREEAAYSMTEALRAFPQGAQIIMPELAKNLDWPGADKIAQKLETVGQNQGLPPELQKQIADGKQLIGDQQKQIGDLTQQLQSAKSDNSIERAKLLISAYEATTARLQAHGDLQLDAVNTIFSMLQPPAQPPPQQAA